MWRCKFYTNTHIFFLWCLTRTSGSHLSVYKERGKKRGGCFWSRAEMSPFCRSFMRYGDLCVSVLLVAIQDVKFRSRTRYKYISNTRVRCARMWQKIKRCHCVLMEWTAWRVAGGCSWISVWRNNKKGMKQCSTVHRWHVYLSWSITSRALSTLHGTRLARAWFLVNLVQPRFLLNFARCSSLILLARAMCAHAIVLCRGEVKRQDETFSFIAMSGSTTKTTQSTCDLMVIHQKRNTRPIHSQIHGPYCVPRHLIGCILQEQMCPSSVLHIR
jgi:hypothetical protein